MEPRILSPRKQDTTSRSFLRRLHFLKEFMHDCCIFESTTYKMNGSKRERLRQLDSSYDLRQVTTLDEYYWLRKSKSDSFYGLGRLGMQYIFFVFHYDDLKEASKLKLTYAASREALVEHAMSTRTYRRYLKDTTE
jgi:hypothetical protein